MRELSKTFPRLLLIAVLAAAGPALAQQADTGEAADPPAAPATEPGQDEAAAPAGDPTLSMGEEVAQDGVGTPYLKEAFGDWQLRCVRAPEGQTDPCQLYQLLNDDAGNSVAEISIFPLQSEQGAVAGATVATPLETLLTQRLRLSVDGGKAKRYEFTWCSAVGCFARIGLAAEDVAAFKRGNAATLTINPVAAPDQDVSLKLSLSGFTAGFDALVAQ